MQGICFQWFIDEFGTNKEFILYISILRLTFGFRKRYAYISSKNLPFKDLHTLKKYRDILTQKGIIEWKTTSGYTMYKILEPKKEISRFILGKDISSSSKENEKDGGGISDW